MQVLHLDVSLQRSVDVGHDDLVVQVRVAGKRTDNLISLLTL